MSIKNFLVIFALTFALVHTTEAKVCHQFFTKEIKLEPFPSKKVDGVNLPDFTKIDILKLRQEIKKAFQLAEFKMDEIATNPEKPTFENTILALEKLDSLGELHITYLVTLDAVLKSQQTADAYAEFRLLAADFSEKRNKNIDLFKRIEEVYKNTTKSSLSEIDYKLLEETYKDYIRSGINLSNDKKQRLAALNKELSELMTKFGDNETHHTSKLAFIIKDKSVFEGLPDSMIQRFKAQAKKSGKAGYLVDLGGSTPIMIMRYAKRTSLRKRLMRQLEKVASRGRYNNLPIAIRINEIRQEIARIHGYRNYATKSLELKMAQTPEKVMQFLEDLQSALYPQALNEVAKVRQAKVDDVGTRWEVKQWDVAYYKERVKEQELQVDLQELQQYFPLNQVLKGAFYTAENLFGLKIQKIQAPVYEKSVETYKIVDAKTKEALGVFYLDPIARLEGKDSGAWHLSFRSQSYRDGQRVLPISSIVTNFSPGAKGEQPLLSVNEVTTVFHEFGHTLHSLLSDVKYSSFSGTSVKHDFVELPSQLMENFALDPSILKVYARHHKTGEVLSDAMIAKIGEIENFMAASAELGQAKMAKLDMKWQLDLFKRYKNVFNFEDSVIKEYQLYNWGKSDSPTTVTFSHVFAGGYAAGYYGYAWSRVLDADIYTRFAENGVLNPQLGQQLRESIYSVGGSIEPMQAFKNFMGREPDPEGLLKKILGPNAE